METCVKDNIKYTFELIDDVLKIRVVPRVFEIYDCCIKNDDEIFKTVNIIKNTQILYKALLDGFRIGFEISILTKCENEIFTLNVSLSTSYINEKITINIPKTSQKITESQLVEYIDSKTKHLKDKVSKSNKKISELVSVIETQKELIVNQAKILGEFETKIKDLEQHVSGMEQMNSKTRENLVNYIRKRPVFITRHLTQSDKIKIIMPNEIEITFVMHNGVCYIDKNLRYPVPHFSFDDLKYLTELETITFINCEQRFLDYLNCVKNLKHLNIINMPLLQSIDRLILFENLETLSLSGTCNITDFHKLVDFPKLEKLIVPRGINIILPPKRNFKLIKYD